MEPFTDNKNRYRAALAIVIHKPNFNRHAATANTATLFLAVDRAHPANSLAFTFSLQETLTAEQCAAIGRPREEKLDLATASHDEVWDHYGSKDLHHSMHW
jgi:hypothetical protein